MKKYLLTSRLAATNAFDGGIMYILGGYLLHLAQLIVLLLIWRSLAAQGADTGDLTLQQLLLYTLASSILSQQLNVITPATTSFWEGSLISRYLRPAPVLLQLIWETFGTWLPGLAFYSLPMLFLSPLLGLNLLAKAGNLPVFLVSLTLSISLGFAIDFLFASTVIFMKNASYTAYVIRQAVTRVFSGALIPFALLPWGVGSILQLLPFGSVASAPLQIFIGSGDTLHLLGLQVLWNLILWPMALVAFKSCEERMVSYGG